MEKKGKSAIIFGLVAVLALATFAIGGIAHINPQGEQTHPVGIETESCQDALAGAEEQFADRGSINPYLVDNIEDKCGGPETCITRTECFEKGWEYVQEVPKELCESELACGIAAEYTCMCALEDNPV